MLVKASLESQLLLELKTELLGGFNDLQWILSRIDDYSVEIWEEHYFREPDRRGRWSYRRLEMKLWVQEHDYQPLANRLGKLDELPISLKRIAPF